MHNAQEHANAQEHGNEEGTETLHEPPKWDEARQLAAYQDVAERVYGQLRPVMGTGDWSQAAHIALDRFLRMLQSDPCVGGVLFVDAVAGGRRMRRRRERVLGELEQLIQEFLDGPLKSGSRPDIPATAVMGALRNVVANHVRTRSEDRLPSLLHDGLAWVQSYAIPQRQERWSTGAHALLPAEPPLPVALVAHSQREQILHATAEVMMTKGYANATVADIAAEAAVSRDVFYAHFSGKQHAFLEAQQHPTQYVLDTTAAAYFSAQEWPERIWHGLRALLGLIAANPAISHLRLVECYAAGPAAIRRAEEITRSFMFFLEEGYSYRPETGGLPRLYSEAIVGAIFEILQRGVAQGQAAQLPRRLPQIAYVTITPFTGHEEAVRLLERLSGRSRPQRARIPRSAQPPAAHR